MFVIRNRLLLVTIYHMSFYGEIYVKLRLKSKAPIVPLTYAKYLVAFFQKLLKHSLNSYRIQFPAHS